MTEWMIWAATIVLSGIGVGYYIRKYKKTRLSNRALRTLLGSGSDNSR